MIATRESQLCSTALSNPFVPSGFAEFAVARGNLRG